MKPFSKILYFIQLAFTISIQVKATEMPHDSTNVIVLSLSEIWEKASKNSKSIQIQKLKIKTSEEEVKDALTERFPEIGASGTYARISNMPVFENGLFHTPDQFPVIHNFHKISGDAYLNVYNGGKVRNNIEAEEVKHAIALEFQHLTVSEIRFKAAIYFLDLKRSYMFKQLLLQDIAEQEKLLVQIRQLHKNGVVLKTDVLRAELKLSRQKMNLLEIENSIDITSRKVAIITGLPDNIRIMVQSDSTNVSDFLPESYETYLAQALKQAFSYKISEKETELSFLKLKQVKTNAAPKIGLFAEYTYAYPQIQFYPYANAAYALGQYGVKVSFPISALYQNKHKEEAARLNILQHELAHSDLGDGIRQQVHESYVRYKESLSRIEVAKNNIVQATENLRIINNTYFNQLALLTDLLDAETQVLQARFDLTSAQIIAQEQYYQLQKTIGNL